MSTHLPTLPPPARHDDTAPCACAAERICDFLFDSLEGALPFDRIALVALEDGDRLVQKAVRATTPDGVIPSGYRGSLQRGSLAAVIASGKPRTLNRLSTYAAHVDSSSPTHLLLQEGYQASLACPLEHQGVAVGLIFFNSLRPDVFRPEHAEIVQRVAPEIASVLSRCKGPEEAPTHEALARSFEAIGRELRAATAEELLVARVLEQIRDGVVVDDVLDRVFEHFHTLLPYDRIGYATLENDRVEARWARSRMPLRLPRGYHLRLGATSLRGIIESGTPRILDDLVAYFKKHPYSRSTQLIVDEGLRSSLTFFLGTEATPLGFLFFASATPSAYTNAHLARMRRITAPLTAAIWRARLYEELSQARARSEELLHMLAPAPIAARLQAGETDIADARVATILFADLVEFTRWSTPLSPVELLHTLRELFARIHDSAERRGVARIRVMGDGYMAAAGAADDAPDHAVRAALHALDILDIVADTRTPDGQRIAVRVGLHTGFVVAGVLGGGDLRFDVWGPAVSVAARLESHGVPGRIQVSADTADRLRGRFALEPQEPVALKGLGPTPVWWLSRLR